MKTLIRFVLPLSFLGLAACGGMKAASSGTSTNTLLADSSSTTTSIVSSAYDSNTVALTASTSLLSQLFFTSQPTNPTDLRVQVDMSNVGNGTYGGDVIIAYEENGVTHHLKVSSQHPYTTVSDTTNNVWHDWQGTGTNQFHALLQDASRAIVVVVDDVLSLGDGSGEGILGGSIWYQNFGLTWPAQGPEKMCWQIQIGPYDCRTFLSSGVPTNYNKATVNTYSSLYPTTYTTGGDDTNGYNGNRPAYIKLGTFSGLSQTAAFNQ